MGLESAPWWGWWSVCVLAGTLLAASVTDVRSGTIPNWITYPGAAIGLVGHTVAGGLFGDVPWALGLGPAAAGLAVGFLPLMLAWMAGGIGGGDAKVMGAVGALAGWRFTLTALLYGLAVGAVMALGIAIYRGVLGRTLRRIGRFVVLLMTPGGPVDPATEDSPRVPLGLAMCIGAALVLADAILRGPVAKRFLVGW